MVGSCGEFNSGTSSSPFYPACLLSLNVLSECLHEKPQASIFMQMDLTQSVLRAPPTSTATTTTNFSRDLIN